MPNLLSKVDPSLIRERGDAGFFNTKLSEVQFGLGIFTSLSEAQIFIPEARVMPIRITPSATGNLATVWVNGDQLNAYRAEEQKVADAKSISDFKKALPFLIAFIALVAIVGGGIAAWQVFINGKIYGFETNPGLAFLIHAGAVLVVGTISLIVLRLNKGNVS